MELKIDAFISLPYLREPTALQEDNFKTVKVCLQSNLDEFLFRKVFVRGKKLKFIIVIFYFINHQPEDISILNSQYMSWLPIVYHYISLELFLGRIIEQPYYCEVTIIQGGADVREICY